MSGVLATAGGVLAAIPSPSQSVWYLGPFPVRAYALSILAGIGVAFWMTQRRWQDRGGHPDQAWEIAFWAVPFGIVGGRIYHVITSPDAYFGPGGDPWRAFAIWEGGLGIWGAVALGAVGAWIACRREGVRLSVYADALAPGLLVAQAIGRLGNWFNQELFGRATTLPWGLQIDAAHLPAGYEPGTLFHPTFLYELVWNLAGAALLLLVDRRRRLGHGRVFWLYVVVYTVGRGWIELLRIDTAHHVLGLRLNVWTALIVGLIGVVGFVVTGRRHPGRESDPYLVARPLADGAEPPEDADPAAGAAPVGRAQRAHEADGADQADGGGGANHRAPPAP